MRKCNLLIAVFLFIVSAQPVYAGGPGTAGGSLLRYNVSPRAEAMGEAQVAVADDVYSIYSNPAGLAWAPQVEFGTTYSKGLVDDYFGQVNAVVALNSSFSLGAGFLSYNGGLFDDVDNNGNIKQVNAQTDYLGTLSGAWRLSKPFAVGASVEFLQSTLIGSVTGKTAAVSLGVVFKPEAPIRFGASLKHWGWPLVYGDGGDALPLTWQTGIAIDFLRRLGPLHNYDLTATLDLGQTLDMPMFYNLGVEYWVQKLYALRAGYKFNRDLEGLTLGAGARILAIQSLPLQLDYSFTQVKELDSVHKVGLTVFWPDDVATIQTAEPPATMLQDKTTFVTTSSSSQALQAEAMTQVPEKSKAAPSETYPLSKNEKSEDDTVVQAKTSEIAKENLKYNFITTNPMAITGLAFPNANMMMGLFKLEYERRIVKRLTLAIMGVYLIDSVTVNGAGNSIYTELGGGMSPRFYFSNTETPKGYWIGLLGLYRTGSMDVKYQNGYGSNYSYKKEVATSTTAGLETGFKWLLADWFTVSPYLGVYYDQRSYLGWSYSQIISGAGVNIGVAF